VKHAEIADKLMDLDHRVNTIEQILPTLLTRDEFQTAMEKVATKKDLEAFRSDMATDLAAVRADMATKKDLEALRSATKTDLAALRSEMATKTDLEALRSEMQLGFVNFSSEIRRHFDVVAESLRGDIRLLADGHSYVVARLDVVDHRLDAIERRLSSSR
jgi:hypothetical protein